MGINKRFIEKYEKAYEGIPEYINPIEFVPTSPYYHLEEWKEVLPMFVPEVLPNTYWISNYARVYTNLSSPKYPNGGILIHSINNKGYHQINLASSNPSIKKIGIKITKLVMLHFNFIPGCYLLEVDHIDGDKDNNCVWNLDWVIPRENTRRAIINGQRDLSPTTKFNGNNLLTDENARLLYLEASMFVANNISLIELMEKYNVSYKYIKGLLSGSIRPYIRKEYFKYQ